MARRRKLAKFKAAGRADQAGRGESGLSEMLDQSEELEMGSLTAFGVAETRSDFLGTNPALRIL
jgi:hypothetical protein